MQTAIGIATAREQLADIVNRVAYGGERFVLERRGKPLVALISAAEYKQLTELLQEAGFADEVHGVPVRVRFDGECFFVSDDRLDLYGVGNTLDEARADYWHAVQEYYGELSQNADRLAAYMTEHLEYLRQVFAPRQQTVEGG